MRNTQSKLNFLGSAPHNTVANATYEKLKHDIIFGKLKPGTKLKLETLRDEYAASVSTLRETLNRLTSDGFVSAAEQRGFFVSPVSADDLNEIATLRILLECHALRESLRNGDDDWEADVVGAYHKLSTTESSMKNRNDADLETWKEYDWQFHLALIRACNSSNLLGLHATLFGKYLRYQILVLTYRGEVARQEHKALFEAVIARDGDAATKLLTQHIMHGLTHTLEYM
ncbi:MAG: FCD domain-containing protein [Bacteroidetes bacterium]|nr:FCD domain-containing protein [Bacteroidota bacterium]